MGTAFHTKTLYTDLGEGDLADPLAQVATANPKVHIIYRSMGDNTCCTD
jgi:hypothetical protein